MELTHEERDMYRELMANGLSQETVMSHIKSDRHWARFYRMPLWWRVKMGRATQDRKCMYCGHMIVNEQNPNTEAWCCETCKMGVVQNVKDGKWVLDYEPDNLLGAELR